MAKLHLHELSWQQIAKEALKWWLPITALWVIWRFVPHLEAARNWTESGIWWKNLLPQPKNTGWGPLSFVSTVTGLNLAIVKLQSFLKAQEDVQDRWTVEGIKRAMDRRPELNADEPTADRFKQAVQAQSKKYVQQINAANLKHWAMWNRWAVRVTVVGFLCLIFGFSSGLLLVPFMLAPIIATWVLGRITAETLFNKIDTVCDLAADFMSKLHEESGKTEKAVAEKLKEAAVPELELNDDHAPPASRY